MNRTRSIVAVLALCLTAGCASTPSMTSANEGQAVQAGKTTFIRVPKGHGEFDVIAYSPSGESVCPECAAIARHYFETGKLDNTVCDKCGSTITVTRGHAVVAQAPAQPPILTANSVNAE